LYSSKVFAINSTSVLEEYQFLIAEFETEVLDTPDGNQVQMANSVVTTAQNLTAEFRTELWKNPENITYGDTIISLSQGAFKHSVELRNWTFQAGQEGIAGLIRVRFFNDGRNYSKFYDSRGSLIRIQWVLQKNNVVIHSWDWYWPQIVLLDGQSMPLFVQFVVVNAEEAAFIIAVLDTTFSSVFYDPHINVLLGGQSGSGDGGEDQTLAIVVGIVVPVAFLLCIGIVIVMVTASVIVVIRFRYYRKLTTTVNF